MTIDEQILKLGQNVYFHISNQFSVLGCFVCTGF